MPQSLNIQDSKHVLQSLWFFSIFQCKDKIQVCLVILNEQKYFDLIKEFSFNSKTSIKMQNNTVTPSSHQSATMRTRKLFLQAISHVTLYTVTKVRSTPDVLLAIKTKSSLV